MNILHERPGIKEYLELRLAAGLSQKEESAAGTALSHSVFSVVIRNDDSELIGMGRIIGDGGCYYQVVDIAVNRSYQDKGLDKVLMDEITEYLNLHIPKDADVLLLAEVPAIGLYQKYGFEFTYPKAISLLRKL
ncbi:GNAT family N-acetyltransferase [Paenibacillus sp. MBLB4367]|uniref:GNAT family N-acetyltransferase n=1 Tax=Paenibacillus sp. MBLB4367 TaxID=3384767 RepID=UPI003908017E